MAHLSNYRGSPQTAKKVCEEIARRFGTEAAQQYDPYSNCLTYRQWQANGFCVKKGEKSIRSVTFVEKKDEAGKVIKKYPKTVHLFFIQQVEALNS